MVPMLCVGTMCLGYREVIFDHIFSLNNRALMATITVLAEI